MSTTTDALAVLSATTEPLTVSEIRNRIPAFDDIPNNTASTRVAAALWAALKSGQVERVGSAGHFAYTLASAGARKSSTPPKPTNTSPHKSTTTRDRLIVDDDDDDNADIVQDVDEAREPVDSTPQTQRGQFPRASLGVPIQPPPAKPNGATQPAAVRVESEFQLMQQLDHLVLHYIGDNDKRIDTARRAIHWLNDKHG